MEEEGEKSLLLRLDREPANMHAKVSRPLEDKKRGARHMVSECTKDFAGDSRRDLPCFHPLIFFSVLPSCANHPARACSSLPPIAERLEIADFIYMISGEMSAEWQVDEVQHLLFVGVSFTYRLVNQSDELSQEQQYHSIVTMN